MVFDKIIFDAKQYVLLFDLSVAPSAWALIHLFQGHIDLFKQGSELIYRLKGANRARGGDAEEKIVYGIIEEAGNKVCLCRDFVLLCCNIHD